LLTDVAFIQQGLQIEKSGPDAILTIGSQSWGMLVKLLGVLVHVSRCNETDSGVSLERIAD
jgi:hypothetical protein